MKASETLYKGKKGFSFVELLVAVMILSLVLTGVLLSFVRYLELSELSRNSQAALAGVKNKMEEIKRTNPTQINANYNNVTFTISGLNGMGVSYVDTSNPNFLDVTVSFCWTLKNGRVIGEDVDLDGQLDPGEDQNGNGLIDSPIQLVTSIYN